jgi:hypothetical protein
VIAGAVEARVLAEVCDQVDDHRPLKAITLHQPWAWAILQAGKPVENRGWPLPTWATGRWIALHAGRPQATEAEDADWIWNVFGVRAPPNPGRGLVGLVKFGMARPPAAPRLQKEHLWEHGPWCWPIIDRYTLPTPIAIRGAQGFWPVPWHDAGQLVVEQLERAGAGGRP